MGARDAKIPGTEAFSAEYSPLGTEPNSEVFGLQACRSMARSERTFIGLTLYLAIGIVIAMKLVLDKMSRLVVPKAIRDRFALAPGNELEVVVESDGFRLRPVHPASPLTSKDGILICTSELPPTAWDVGAFLDKEREQRSRQIGGM